MPDITNWRNKPFLTPQEIADILGVHRNTAYVIVHSLPHVSIGERLLRVSTPVFEKWLRDNERRNAHAQA